MENLLDSMQEEDDSSSLFLTLPNTRTGNSIYNRNNVHNPTTWDYYDKKFGRLNFLNSHGKSGEQLVGLFVDHTQQSQPFEFA
jgi:hypothetical protein